MQKKILGVAVAAALVAPGLALAQSSVQIYGTINMSLARTSFDNVPAASGGNISKYAVNSHSSNWGIRSTESLGGGMSAWFQAEFNVQMERRSNDNANIAQTGEGSQRNSGLGLRGGFGNVYVGTWETPWAQTFRLWDVGTISGYGPTTSIIGRRESTNSGTSFIPCNLTVAVANPATGAANTTVPLGGCTSTAVQAPTAFGGANNLGYSLWRRYQNAVFYESPEWSGVQLKVAIQPNETKNNAIPATTIVAANPYSWSGSLSWTGMGGRGRAFLATMQSHDWSSAGNTDGGWTFGGGYDFGVANLGATYEQYTYKTGSAGQGGQGIGDIKAKEWAIGLAVPVGPGKIGASYAKAKDLGIAGQDTSAKMWNLGYEWALSKRTALSFGVAKIDNGTNQGFTWTGATGGPSGPNEASPLPNGTDQTNYFVGIRHSF
ncbi:MAG TPA: porin [Burkholderiales bacterium]|nr:porin [Burkholderiales bacterium]